MPAPSSNLTRVTERSGPSVSNFWISDPELIEDGEGDWGFAVYVDKDVFVATFTYQNYRAAMHGKMALAEALKDVVFVATAER